MHLGIESIIGFGSVLHRHLKVRFRHERYGLEVDVCIVVLMRYHSNQDVQIAVCAQLELEGGGLIGHDPLQRFVR